MKNDRMIKGIVIEQVDGKPVGRGPYRNIKNVDRSINGFLKNMKLRFPNATHVNFYDGKRNYLFRKYYQVQEIDIQIKPIKRKRLSITYLDYYFCVTGQPRFWNECLFRAFDP